METLAPRTLRNPEQLRLALIAFLTVIASGCTVPLENATGLTEESREAAQGWLDDAIESCRIQRAYFHGKDDTPLVPNNIMEELEFIDTPKSRRDEIFREYGDLIEKERQRMRDIRLGQIDYQGIPLSELSTTATLELTEAGCEPVIKFWCDVESKNPFNKFYVLVRNQWGKPDCIPTQY